MIPEEAPLGIGDIIRYGYRGQIARDGRVIDVKQWAGWRAGNGYERKWIEARMIRCVWLGRHTRLKPSWVYAENCDLVDRRSTIPALRASQV